MVSSRRNDGTITQELRYPFAGTAVQFRQESSMQKGINPIESNGIIISLTLNNGKKTQTGYLKYSDVEMAEYTLEKEFPGKYVNALGELVLEDDEVED